MDSPQCIAVINLTTSKETTLVEATVNYARYREHGTGKQNITRNFWGVSYRLFLLTWPTQRLQLLSPQRQLQFMLALYFEPAID